MYANAGYLNDSIIDFMDNSKPLIVCSCGTYRLITLDQFHTYRPTGRVDYQLLYVASGLAHFWIDGEEKLIPAGHMIIYYPNEMQNYIYYGKDQTEVYWVHFTGGDVDKILQKNGILPDTPIISCGTSLEYARIFKQMILELQQNQTDYEEMLSMLLQQIFISLHRQLTKERKIKNEYIETEMELATQYFNANYNTNISIEEYATSRGMSVSWFIRSFKQYTGSTPMQYIVSLRITNAQVLLENTSYNVKEIGLIVGYDNPLYFSRIFSKQKGMSPKEYRRQVISNISG